MLGWSGIFRSAVDEAGLAYPMAGPAMHPGLVAFLRFSILTNNAPFMYRVGYMTRSAFVSHYVASARAT